MPSSTRQRPNVFLTAAGTVLALARFTAAVAYTWPDPQYEALESLFYEGAGLGGIPVSDFVFGCPLRDGTKTTVAAEWVRLAFHDSATFNVTDGTGGLDASIYYELERDENIGAGMTGTATELSASSNRYVSRADVIAMAATWALAACKGPILPFRGGRLDALQAGRKGVPEPHQELKDHVESFRLQGFNATEMISLVACGHTLGGVREQDFPTVVPPSGNATVRRFDSFDSTEGFDNAVATEYLAGTTKNPLVVNSNATVQSDLRIFSSDQNVTMKSFRDLNTFANTCKTLLTRMLENVPTGVMLTEPILPIPFKLASQRFQFINGELAFFTKLRILETFNSTRNQTSPAKRTVRLLWCDKRGANAGCADGTANAATAVPLDSVDDSPLPPDDSGLFSGSPVSRRLSLAMSYYGVAVSVAFERSVGKFWFVVDEDGAAGTNLTVVDNGGKGYIAVDDEIVYLPVGFSDGPRKRPRITELFNSPFPLYIAAGIHNSTKVDSVRINAYDNTFNAVSTPREDTDVGNPRDVLNQTFSLSQNVSLSSLDGYDFYSIEVVDGIGPRYLTADFEADLSDASTGAKTRTVGLNFVEMIEPRVVPVAPPPLGTILKVSLSSVGGNGSWTPPTTPGSSPGSGASGLPAIGFMFYAFVGFSACLVCMG